MADIFREVDEEVRKDRLHGLWKRYGIYLIVAVVAVVAGTAANVGWREYQTRQRLADAASYFKAAETYLSGDRQQAISAFATLADEASGGYVVLARLREAAGRAGVGDTTGAVAIYDGLASDGGVDKVFRDLAQMLAALHLADTASAADIETRLQPLLTEDSAWRYSARELLAMLALEKGDRVRARDELERLRSDDGAPNGVRARASELLTTLQ